VGGSIIVVVVLVGWGGGCLVDNEGPGGGSGREAAVGNHKIIALLNMIARAPFTGAQQARSSTLVPPRTTSSYSSYSSSYY
jgi:hypothetical protein